MSRHREIWRSLSPAQRMCFVVFYPLAIAVIAFSVASVGLMALFVGAVQRITGAAHEVKH